MREAVVRLGPPSQVATSPAPVPSCSSHHTNEQRQQRQHHLRQPLEPVHTFPRRTVCVDGRPFDKHGRCFVHPHVKLASKKMLGGWKIRMEFCPLCDDGHAGHNGGRGDHGIVISGVSRLTDDSGFSSYCDSSYRSRKSNKSSTSRAASVSS